MPAVRPPWGNEHADPRRRRRRRFRCGTPGKTPEMLRPNVALRAKVREFLEQARDSVDMVPVIVPVLGQDIDLPSDNKYDAKIDLSTAPAPIAVAPAVAPAKETRVWTGAQAPSSVGAAASAPVARPWTKTAVANTATPAAALPWNLNSASVVAPRPPFRPQPRPPVPSVQPVQPVAVTPVAPPPPAPAQAPRPARPRSRDRRRTTSRDRRRDSPSRRRSSSRGHSGKRSPSPRGRRR